MGSHLLGLAGGLLGLGQTTVRGRTAAASPGKTAAAPSAKAPCARGAVPRPHQESAPAFQRRKERSVIGEIGPAGICPVQCGGHCIGINRRCPPPPNSAASAEIISEHDRRKGTAPPAPRPEARGARDCRGPQPRITISDAPATGAMSGGAHLCPSCMVSTTASPVNADRWRSVTGGQRRKAMVIGAAVGAATSPPTTATGDRRGDGQHEKDRPAMPAAR